MEDGIENTISGPATSFEVDPTVAARMGFTPQEVAEDATAILDGVTTTDPLIANGRPYTVRVRLGDETRQSLDTIENTVFNSTSGKLATLGSLAKVTQLPPQNEIRRENLQRMVVVTAQLEGSDLGTAIAKVQTHRQRYSSSFRRLESSTAAPIRSNRNLSANCCRYYCCRLRSFLVFFWSSSETSPHRLRFSCPPFFLSAASSSRFSSLAQPSM